MFKLAGKRIYPDNYEKLPFKTTIFDIREIEDDYDYDGYRNIAIENLDIVPLFEKDNQFVILSLSIKPYPESPKEWYKIYKFIVTKQGLHIGGLKLSKDNVINLTIHSFSDQQVPIDITIHYLEF